MHGRRADASGVVPTWGVGKDPLAPEVHQRRQEREKAQDFSDKLQLRNRKIAEKQRPLQLQNKRQSSLERKRSWSPEARNPPPPLAGPFSARGPGASPYTRVQLATGSLAKSPSQISVLAPREVGSLDEFGGEVEWCSRHHITWSRSNTRLPRNKRIYFDPLPQVSVSSGSYTDCPVFWPDSGADSSNHDMQRAWQLLHYPFNASRATLSASSSCEGLHLGQDADVPAANAITLPSLSENRMVVGGAHRGSVLDKNGRQIGGSYQVRTSLKQDGQDGQDLTKGSANKRQSVRTFAKVERKSVMRDLAGATCLGHFIDWCHEKHGHMVRVFRILDKSGNMKLSKNEFTTGLNQLMYKIDVPRLWEIFDRDQSGSVSFLHFAAEDAIVLAHFKHWADVQFGSSAGVFRALDTSRDGKLSFMEFTKGIRRLGFDDHVNTCVRRLFELVDEGGDERKRSISADEMAFLDKWECPEYLWVEPDFEAKEIFINATIARFHHNPLLAWRKALDKDSSMRVGYEEFKSAIKLMSQKKVFKTDLSKNVSTLFRALDGSNTGWLSLRDFHEPTYQSLITFSTWAKAEFGKVSLCCKAMAGPEDEDQLSFKSFRKVIKPSLGLDNDEAWKLFEGLSLESKKDGTIKPDELFFLDRWHFEAELEEELAWEKMMTDLHKELKVERPLTAEQEELKDDERVSQGLKVLAVASIS